MGKNFALASLICGIISVVCWIGGYSAGVSVVLGIVGIILSLTAGKSGYVGGMRTAGFVLSLIGLVAGAIIFVSCMACGSCLVCASMPY